MVAVLAAAGLAVARATRSTPEAAPQALDKVVLLGDSYSSGNGAGGYLDSCFRTPLAPVGGMPRRSARPSWTSRAAGRSPRT